MLSDLFFALLKGLLFLEGGRSVDSFGLFKPHIRGFVGQRYCSRPLLLERPRLRHLPSHGPSLFLRPDGSCDGNFVAVGSGLVSTVLGLAGLEGSDLSRYIYRKIFVFSANRTCTNLEIRICTVGTLRVCRRGGIVVLSLLGILSSVLFLL